jgi:hypothetical protein
MICPADSYHTLPMICLLRSSTSKFFGWLTEGDKAELSSSDFFALITLFSVLGTFCANIVLIF